MDTDVNQPPAATLRVLSLAVLCLTALGPIAHRTCAASREGETWRLWGRTYENVRVQDVTPATVTIFHADGIIQLELENLPNEMQRRFNYDPREAARWKDEVREEVQARVIAGRPPPPEAPAEDPEAAPRTTPPGTAVVPGQVEFREEVDLRPIYRERGLFTKNQGRRPSCGIFAVVSALEFEIAREAGAADPLSEEFLIWATLQIQPGVSIDDGYHFAEVITALQTYGVPPLDLVPNTFGKKVETIRPSGEAIAAAESRRSVTPVWFRPDDPHLIERIVAVLNEGTPVIVGVQWPHWRTLETNNLLRDQQPVEGGGHAVTMVGYRNSGGTADGTTFIFRNSYGQTWGMGGFGFMAASYLREHVISALHLRIP